MLKYDLGSVVAWFGIIASLIWNYINYRTAVENRRVSREHEQFNLLRSPVEQQLASFRSHCVDLRSLSMGIVNLEEVRGKVEKVHEEIARSFSGLTDELNRLDRSSYAHGNDWGDSIVESWDRYSDEFDKIRAPKHTSENFGTYVSRLADLLDEIPMRLQDKLEKEVSRIG